MSEADWVEVSFENHDILCLEMLRLSDPSSDFAVDIIQDYDPHAWNVNTEEQDWTSATGREITYFTNNCDEDWRQLSKASNDFVIFTFSKNCISDPAIPTSLSHFQSS